MVLGRPFYYQILTTTQLRFFIYATDPEPEEEGELDPSCVWLAALQVHVPEEAVPLRGAVRCGEGEGGGGNGL